MTTRRMCTAAILATTSLLIGANVAQAQTYSLYNQGYGAYRPSTQFYTYSSNHAPLYSNNVHRVPTYAPYGINSVEPRFNGGYQYPKQLQYSSRYGYRGSSSIFGSSNYYSYPARSGISIQFGTGGYGNRGFGLRRRF